MKRTTLLSLLLINILALASQNATLRSVVVNGKNVPVAAVVCVLRSTTDTLLTKTAVTDMQGKFVIDNLPEGDYRLWLQHLAYHRGEYILTLAGGENEMPPYILFSSDTELGEVVISAERPIVKAADGKLIYDVPMLVKDKVATNALDVLKNIPNIMSSGGDDIRLVGSDDFTILMDGQPTGMTLAQLISVLKAMPASRIANVEIMYSAPPRYNVRGAAINIVLTGQSAGMPAFQGEGKLGYRQRTYGGVNANGSLLYNKNGLTADVMLDLARYKSTNYNEMYARHKYNNHVYDITQENKGSGTWNDQAIRVGLGYGFENKSKVQLTYTGNYDQGENRPVSTTGFLEDQQPYSHIKTSDFGDSESYLHNATADYKSHFRLNAGVDYTYYKDPETTLYNQYSGDVLSHSYKTRTEQNINSLQIYANHSATVGKAWELDYGVKFAMSKNNNVYDYFRKHDTLLPDSINETRQKEHSASVFAGFNKTFTPKLTVQASLSANYFKATIDYMGEKKTLWDDLQPFANANITYNNAETKYQLSFSSDIKYPAYWALSNNKVQLNAYSVVQGNPELKFSKSYKTQFLFMLKRKYMLIAYYDYRPDYVIQLPSQSQTALENVFKMVNLDYQKSYGTTFVVPFGLGKALNSRLSLSLIRQEQKDSDFYSIPYKRALNTFAGKLTNTVNISSRPDIKLDISAFYMNGAIQGAYDIGRMYNIDAGAKWTFLDNRAELSAQVEDIFRTGGARTTIDFAGQYSTMKIRPDAPAFKLAFIYRFGGYKKQKTDSVDRSRFGKGG